MAAFPPDFNIDCFIWRTPIVPPGLPDVDVECQLYIASRGLVDITPGSPGDWVPPIYLRVPALTDIRPTDQVECPQHSGRYYSCRWVEDAHKGFPNEYRVGLLEQTVQPFPLP